MLNPSVLHLPSNTSAILKVDEEDKEITEDKLNFLK